MANPINFNGIFKIKNTYQNPSRQKAVNKIEDYCKTQKMPVVNSQFNSESKTNDNDAIIVLAPDNSDELILSWCFQNGISFVKDPADL